MQWTNKVFAYLETNMYYYVPQMHVYIILEHISTNISNTIRENYSAFIRGPVY